MLVEVMKSIAFEYNINSELFTLLTVHPTEQKFQTDIRGTPEDNGISFLTMVYATKWDTKGNNHFNFHGRS
jgi:hypothetical protein